jgi:hypothetical protein
MQVQQLGACQAAWLILSLSDEVLPALQHYNKQLPSYFIQSAQFDSQVLTVDKEYTESVLCCDLVQTPSLIPPVLLERIIGTLQQQYSISPSAEISMEADPGTFDLTRLQQYRALGVNRLSMGVQCFDQVRRCSCLGARA